MTDTFVGNRDGVYDRTSPLEMTQVYPQPVQPATEIQLPDIDDISHITLHQVKNMHLKFNPLFVQLISCKQAVFQKRELLNFVIVPDSI